MNRTGVEEEGLGLGVAAYSPKVYRRILTVLTCTGAKEWMEGKVLHFLFNLIHTHTHTHTRAIRGLCGYASYTFQQQ